MRTQDQWIPVQLERSSTAVAVTFCLGVLAGTGGLTSHELFRARLGTGSVSQGIEHASPSVAAEDSAFHLESIRSALRLSIHELAQLFRVSRPTIYSWQKGQSVREKNAARLRVLAAALEPHLVLLHAQTGRIGHRAIEGRMTVLQLLQDGREPRETLNRLAAILARESAQRQRMNRRLEGKTPRIDAETDVLA